MDYISNIVFLQDVDYNYECLTVGDFDDIYNASKVEEEILEHLEDLGIKVK